MNYPIFFDTIETIKLQDDLSAFLGSFEDGIVEFSYLDIVKSAGHSCPTVAGAYIMTMVALKNLYKDTLAKRGEIKISFKEDSKEGVVGVISNVMGQITGATEHLGFKGINGNFARNNLINFSEKIDSSVRFTRVDTKESIELIYDPSVCPPKQKQQELMKKISQGLASKEEKKEFAKLWQERVKDIFENIDKVISIK